MVDLAITPVTTRNQRLDASVKLAASFMGSRYRADDDEIRAAKARELDRLAAHFGNDSPQYRSAIVEGESSRNQRLGGGQIPRPHPAPAAGHRPHARRQRRRGPVLPDRPWPETGRAHPRRDVRRHRRARPQTAPATPVGTTPPRPHRAGRLSRTARQHRHPGSSAARRQGVVARAGRKRLANTAPAAATPAATRQPALTPDRNASLTWSRYGCARAPRSSATVPAERRPSAWANTPSARSSAPI
jgi:hypothetical protein